MNMFKKCAAALVVAFVSYATGVTFPAWAWWFGWVGGTVSIGAMHLIDLAEDRT